MDNASTDSVKSTSDSVKSTSDSVKSTSDSVKSTSDSVKPTTAPSEKPFDETEYLGSIENYYKLKSGYDSKIKDKIVKAINRNIELPAAERKQLIANVKSNCVNCHRPVGTVFDIKKGTLIAICGDTVSPCDLNIKIRQPHTTNLFDTVNQSYSDLEPFKQNVIVDKMNHLFGFGDANKFKTDVEDVNILFSFYSAHLKDLDNITNNMESKIKITDLREKIQTIAAEMKELLVEPTRLKYQIYADQYINQMLPMISALRKESGKIMYMDRDVITSAHRLVKYSYNPAALDITNEL